MESLSQQRCTMETWSGSRCVFMGVFPFPTSSRWNVKMQPARSCLFYSTWGKKLLVCRGDWNTGYTRARDLICIHWVQTHWGDGTVQVSDAEQRTWMLHSKSARVFLSFPTYICVVSELSFDWKCCRRPGRLHSETPVFPFSSLIATLKCATKALEWEYLRA